MLYDAFQANTMNTSSSLDANPEVFCNMLESAQQPLYKGCKITELETSMRLFSIKSGHNLSQQCFNQMVGLVKDTCPTESHIPNNYHQLMRKVKELGTDVQGIDCC